jgi:tetratricopeptide (TPR) repeat protein
MKKSVGLVRLVGMLLIASAQANGNIGSAAAKSPDWGKATREMGAVLSAPNADIAELATNVEKSTPIDAQAALYKFRVLLHAGMDLEAVDAVRELRTICPNWDGLWASRLSGSIVSNVFGDASESEAWDAARAVVEAFGEVQFDDTVPIQVEKHFLESGWTVDQVDTWLAARPSGWQNFWIKQRLCFNLEHHRGDGLMRELKAPVLADPNNEQAIRLYLDMLTFAKRHLPRQEFDMAWFGQAVKPKLAVQAGDIANRIEGLGDWSTSLFFYQQAIEIPLTEGENLQGQAQVFVPYDQAKARFEVGMREGIVRCLLQLKRNDEAQKWMEEASALRQKNNLGYGSVLAGSAQLASGQRTIENKIKSDEPLSESDPQYWYDRAQYYYGRKEPNLAEEAFKRGLAVAESHQVQEQGIAVVDRRQQLLYSYESFLKDQKRPEDAISLLRRELEQASPNSVSYRSAASQLLLDFRTRMDPDDVTWWSWFSSRPEWGPIELGLLNQMLSNTRPGEIDRYVAQVEQLPRLDEPTRCYMLGYWMYGKGLAKRAVPLLEKAAANGTNEKARDGAHGVLPSAYRAAGDWKRAEEANPTPTYGGGSFEPLCEWYTGLAMLAAKAGNKDDAIRLWKRAANLSPSYTRGLDDLVAAGLKERLIEFYRQMQAKMPTSKYPPKVLKMLGER